MTLDDDKDFMANLVKEEKEYRKKQRQFLRDTCKSFILIWPGRKIKSDKGLQVYPMNAVIGMSAPVTPK